jgi:hypothetical protein
MGGCFAFNDAPEYAGCPGGNFDGLAVPGCCINGSCGLHVVAPRSPLNIGCVAPISGPKLACSDLDACVDGDVDASSGGDAASSDGGPE